MNAVYFLCGVFVGIFLMLFIAWISILAERRKNRKHEKWRERFIKTQVDWILAHQPSDEELKEMFSEHLEVKGDDYSKMFENCEKNVKGGEE